MALNNQFQRLKENWLLLAIVVVVLIVFSGLSPTQKFTNKLAMDGVAEMSATGSSRMVYSGYEGFAPEAQQRFITKTASLSTEIERGTFQQTDSRIKDLIRGFNAIIINENQNKNGEGRTSYLSSSYTIKIETSKYDPLVSQLRETGEVTYFSENADDITEQKLNLETELQAEKERLKRFQHLFEEASTTQEKIDLTDRIFNQERTIKYYEEALENVNNRVSYSTVYFTVTEKKSDFANAVFIKFSQIVTSFVESINSLINLIVVIIPWTIALGILWLIYRKFKS